MAHPMESDRAAGILGTGKLRQVRRADHVLVKREVLDGHKRLRSEVEAVCDAYGDKGWAQTAMVRRLRAALDSTPETTEAT